MSQWIFLWFVVSDEKFRHKFLETLLVFEVLSEQVHRGRKTSVTRTGSALNVLQFPVLAVFSVKALSGESLVTLKSHHTGSALNVLQFARSPISLRIIFSNVKESFHRKGPELAPVCSQSLHFQCESHVRRTSSNVKESLHWKFPERVPVCSQSLQVST